MKKLFPILAGGLLLSLAAGANAQSGQPNFGAALYGDGQVWGTKGTTTLPAPNANNMQSYDNLYVFTNANNPNAMQLPVSEAAPGNPNYNGGRWHLQLTTWTAAGVMANGGYAPILKSESEIMYNQQMGYLTIDAQPVFFQCPLLPVK